MAPQPSVTFHRDGRVSVKLRGSAPVLVGKWLSLFGGRFALLDNRNEKRVKETATRRALRTAAISLFNRRYELNVADLES